MANFHSYEYNTLDWYDRGGSFTWTKPDDIDTSPSSFTSGEREDQVMTITLSPLRPPLLAVAVVDWL